MRKLSDAEIYKIFKPELTPKKMLDLGVLVVHILVIILKSSQKTGLQMLN